MTSLACVTNSRALAVLYSPNVSRVAAIDFDNAWLLSGATLCFTDTIARVAQVRPICAIRAEGASRQKLNQLPLAFLLAVLPLPL